ncbi:hypothetical protein [Spirosoma fluviale]|uniref:Outer membrane protein beta-barrel domain-containing protein n=1 Tax=Spirosoma fluviale TaxID=1597977 RepID=A0A286GP36_9BACT|nr:hypothetical protein [Spirosoma fluviale]SOD96839.1 hypothetical protein SAMN06269250_5525 [Spirosoma fluviale]
MKNFNFSILLILGLFVGTQSFAQYVPDKGSKLLNLGIGVGGYGGIGFGGGGIAFGGSFEAGVAKNITVGGIASFRSYSGVGSYYSIGARGSYHFNELLNMSDEKVDLYGGLGLIYSGFSYKDGFLSSAYNYGGIDLGLHIGGRYFFSEKVGGFAEVGVGVAPLQLGVTFKL